MTAPLSHPLILQVLLIQASPAADHYHHDKQVPRCSFHFTTIPKGQSLSTRHFPGASTQKLFIHSKRVPHS